MPAMNVAVSPRGLSSLGGSRPIALSGRSARVSVRRSVVVVRADSVDDAVSKITSGVETAGSAARAALGAAQTAAGYAKQAVDVVAPVAKSAVDKAMPVAKDAASAISKAASPAVKSLVDKVPSAGQELDKALSSQGINAKPVVSAGSQAVETIKPAANGFFSWFLTQSILTQAETVGVAAVAVYFGPSIIGFLAGALQGYRGDIMPAAALNTLSTDSSSVLVDIRSVSEKEASGIPVLPGAASKRTVELELDTTEDKKLRSLLSNADSVEAQVTALKIAALKRTKKGSPLILLDKNGSTAKVVAKELAKKGFGKVFVVSGGFDGRNGWVQSKLQFDVAKTVSTATVVTASPVRRVLPQVTPSIAPSMTVSSKTVGGSRSTKSLPAPKK